MRPFHAARLGLAFALVLALYSAMPLAPPSLAAGNTSLQVSSSQAQSPTVLSLAPASMIISPGDNLAVNVNLDMVSQSHAVVFVLLQLRFDPQVLQATSFEPNTAGFPQLNVIERTALGPGVGTIGLALGTGSSYVNAIQDSGTLATITFHAVGNGNSSTLIAWQRFVAYSVMPWDPASLNVIERADPAAICLDKSPCLVPRLYLPLLMAIQ